MSYAKNLLSRGEEVVFESRQHWFAVLAETWTFVIASIIALALLIWATTSDIGGARGIVQIIALLGLLVSLAYIGIKVWAWRNQEYLITTRRVIKAEGIFNKAMGDSSLEKVNDARLTQSWIGRIFDYGTLDILTASEAAETGAAQRLPDAGRAGEVQGRDAEPEGDAWSSRTSRRLRCSVPPRSPPCSAPSRCRRAPAPTASLRYSRRLRLPRRLPRRRSEPPTGGAGQLASTLESLAGLRDKGLITPEEYEAKKRELLERM